MALGLRAKNWNSASVQVDYLVHVHEVRPWPPSSSLRSLKSVQLQWENGDCSSGSTSPAVPSLGSVVGDGRIIFNKSFRLPVTLSREVSVKGGDANTFQKNCLEFNLYELRRDNTVRGPLLGTVIIDLAEYGILKETVNINAPMNCKRSFKNTTQPVLFVKIQPFKKHSSNILREGLSKELSLDKDGMELVSALINEEYNVETDISSFTSADVLSHSTPTVPPFSLEATECSTCQREENVSEAVKDITGRGNRVAELLLELEPAKPQVKLEVNERIVNSRNRVKANTSQPIREINSNSPLAEAAFSDTDPLVRAKYDLLSTNDCHVNGEDDGKAWGQKKDCPGETGSTNRIYTGLMENRDGEKQEEQIQKEKSNFTRAGPLNQLSPDAITKPLTSPSDTLTFSRRGFGVKGNTVTSDKLRNVKSVRDTPFMEDVKEIYILEDARNGARNYRKSDVKEAPIARREATNSFLDSKVLQLECRIEKLEGELREAAAVEVSLYSIVAEHGNSANKVHAPARRLSRLYLHACRQGSQARRSSAARSIISGLVLVAKACGNDVPRLTFWLSNSVVLRAIIFRSVGNLQLLVSATRPDEIHGGGKGNGKRSFTLKWKESSPIVKEKKLDFTEFFDWEDPHTFTTALEKIEAWIFSRIVESVWWQTFTPRMQSVSSLPSEQTMGSSMKKSYKRRSGFGDKQSGVSLNLWKKAFKDASERLCPVRAEGHECGCLPVLARLIMEQCVARLDVAMFNAFLRDSTDEIPTDPVSDPISDPKVLPIPAGKSSFGAGAQLKNVIGTWSRWLTDLFGIHYDDSKDENVFDDDERLGCETLFKTFYLLDALSDLMMLPKDMLLNGSIRKEVCPTLGASLIKRILTNFVPDEFCPDPIPEAVFEVLDFEVPLEDEERSIRNFPCKAAPIVYSPPSAASLAFIIGDGVGSESQLRRSGSSVLRKSYTSDDELDELDAPLRNILRASHALNWKPKENGGLKAVRYKLLREVWRDED